VAVESGPDAEILHSSFNHHRKVYVESNPQALRAATDIPRVRKFPPAFAPERSKEMAFMAALDEIIEHKSKHDPTNDGFDTNKRCPV
jgi:hypothetical protein